MGHTREGFAMRRLLFSVFLTLLACVLVLGGVITLGQRLRRQLRDEPRYQFPTAEIECEAPLGMNRVQFLSEVQYLGDLPDHVSLLDDGLADRLAASFSRHVWVEKVDRVEIGPGKKIIVHLTFRTPVLAVTFMDQSAQTRAVDRKGLLLPREVEVKKLPVLTGLFPPPLSGAGKAWGDPEIEGGARVAALILPHQSRLKLTALKWVKGELSLGRDEFRSGPMVIWGHAPGEELPSELPAERKLQRLLDYCGKHGGLDRPDPNAVHDLRKE